MGFRLSSAVAGFATRTSENLKSLQDKADEITKTAAARYAEEAKDVRKERMKSIREYSRKARSLASLGLNNSQVETVLSAGLGKADEFEKAIGFAALEAKNKGIEFDDKQFITDAFGARNLDVSPEGSGRTIVEQAKLYAQEQTPFIGADAETIGAQVSDATKTLFGSLGKGYGESQFKAYAQAAGGTAPIDVQTDRALGASTGYNLSGLPALSVDPLVSTQLQESKATIASIETSTKLAEQNFEYLQDLNPIRIRKIFAEVKGLNIANQTALWEKETAKHEALMSKTKETILNLQIDKLEGDIKQQRKDLNKVEDFEEHLATLTAMKSNLRLDKTLSDEEKTARSKLIDEELLATQIQNAAFEDATADNQGFSGSNLITLFNYAIEEEQKEFEIGTTNKFPSALGTDVAFITDPETDEVVYNTTAEGGNVKRFKEIIAIAKQNAVEKFKKFDGGNRAQINQLLEIVGTPKVNTSTAETTVSESETISKPKEEAPLTDIEIQEMGVNKYLEEAYKESQNLNKPINRQKLGEQLVNIFPNLESADLFSMFNQMEENYPLKKKEDVRTFVDSGISKPQFVGTANKGPLFAQGKDIYQIIDERGNKQFVILNDKGEGATRLSSPIRNFFKTTTDYNIPE